MCTLRVSYSFEFSGVQSYVVGGAIIVLESLELLELNNCTRKMHPIEFSSIKMLWVDIQSDESVYMVVVLGNLWRTVLVVLSGLAFQYGFG